MAVLHSCVMYYYCLQLLSETLNPYMFTCQDPLWPKPYFRQALALTHLKRYSEAITAAQAGLAVAPGDAQLQQLLDELQQLQQRQQPRHATATVSATAYMPGAGRKLQRDRVQHPVAEALQLLDKAGMWGKWLSKGLTIAGGGGTGVGQMILNALQCIHLCIHEAVRTHTCVCGYLSLSCFKHNCVANGLPGKGHVLSGMRNRLKTCVVETVSHWYLAALLK